ncbi:hypothetical protein [Streptomyces sparsus]
MTSSWSVTANKQKEKRAGAAVGRGSADQHSKAELNALSGGLTEVEVGLELSCIGQNGHAGAVAHDASAFRVAYVTVRQWGSVAHS